MASVGAFVASYWRPSVAVHLYANNTENLAFSFAPCLSACKALSGKATPNSSIAGH